MLRALGLLPFGIFAVALSATGLPPDAAANEPAVPAFTLPSDTAPAQGKDHEFLFRTDPTGELVPNVANPDIPTEKTNATNDQFLTHKRFSTTTRIDTTDSACEYYKALGTVTHVANCGANGDLLDEDGGKDKLLTFEKWRHDVKIDNHGPAGKTDVAHFINQIDLNLTRDHHLISYAADELAGYVCNHAGPAPTEADPSGLFPTQREVNRLIRSIKVKSGVIACVAMEYSTRGLPAGAQPFVRFFIFGENGNLLSTVDLDGRGPKGVPHVCTACHGGPFNPATEVSVTDGQGLTTLQFNPASNGDLGAHFLPFDQDNFAFSSKLTKAEQDEVIFRLNLDVYTTEASRAAQNAGSDQISTLISNWYHGQLTRNNPSPGFDPGNTVPDAWSTIHHSDVYLNAYAHSCRTCHVAMDSVPLEQDPSFISANAICTTHVMPNSKVTFDHFWLSDPSWDFPQMVVVPGQPASVQNQPDLLSALTGTNCDVLN